MKKWGANFMLKLLGWRIVEPVPNSVSKAVLIVAPHTSNWDFIYGMLALLSSGINFKFLIKKAWVFFPLSLIMKALGAIPIERNKLKKSLSQVDHVSQIIANSSNVILVITPEGTRSYTSKWRTGFYAISQKANVPIMIGYIDYKTKSIGVKEVFYPTGDIEQDISYITNSYKGVSAKYPEKTNI
jgi:1-acyl-sn-glycerol-3-phosphate acyltransferase